MKFKVDCEWVCNFIRSRVYYENLPFDEGIKILMDSFNALSEDDAHKILEGEKKIVGTNTGTLVEDNKRELYEKYLSRKNQQIIIPTLPEIEEVQNSKEKVGRFSEYGIISPDGEFYPCKFGGHSDIADMVCEQMGFISDDNSGGSQFDAQDFLFGRGWIFVNKLGASTFFSKWGEIENMPQKAMDTCYDYTLWECGNI